MSHTEGSEVKTHVDPLTIFGSALVTVGAWGLGQAVGSHEISQHAPEAVGGALLTLIGAGVILPRGDASIVAKVGSVAMGVGAYFFGQFSNPEYYEHAVRMLASAGIWAAGALGVGAGTIVRE